LFHVSYKRQKHTIHIKFCVISNKNGGKIHEVLHKRKNKIYSIKLEKWKSLKFNRKFTIFKTKL
jgi:hypothetical protein